MNSCYLLIVSRFGLKQKQMNVNCKQNLTKKKKMYKQQTKSEQLFTKQTKKNQIMLYLKSNVVKQTNKQKQTRSINLLIAIHRDRLQSREIDKAENTSDDRQTHTQKERVTKYELEN